MEIRRLSNKENSAIANCIMQVIANEKNNSIAIYLNYYRVEEVDYIDVNLVKEFGKPEYEIIPCEVKNLVIRKHEKSAGEFSYGLMHYRERCNAKDLLNGDIIMDTKDEAYKAIAEEAERFGFVKYENNIIFEPQINIAKVKKLK